jgi:hypothetical protein
VILVCQKSYSYGQMPRIPAKQAKDLDLDPKAYHGGPVQAFEAGKEYEVDDTLAGRLLRDYGPKRGRTDVRFVPKDPSEYIGWLSGTGQAEKVTLKDVLDRGFVSAEGGAPEQSVDVEPAVA